MREEGWIIAARRRDGGTPSLVKAVGSETVAHVYWAKIDAEAALARLDDRVYAVFRVEVMVVSAA